MGMRMLSVMFRRLAITFFEMVSEAIFLGILFGLLLLPGQELPGLKLSIGVLLISPAPVILVLCLWGYYFTRPIFGLLGRVVPTWVYCAISAALFALHMSFAIVRLRADISPAARAVTMPFLVGGTVIVFCCALCGDRLLRRWMSVRSMRVPVLPSGAAL